MILDEAVSTVRLDNARYSVKQDKLRWCSITSPIPEGWKENRGVISCVNKLIIFK